MGPEAGPFRRRTPPTPQATRLMKVSLGAGLVFLLVLGVVFVPTALRYDRPPPPTIVLGLAASDPVFVVEVVRVNVRQPLASYRGELNLTHGQTRIDVDMRPLAERAWGPNDTVRFADVDGDGMLSAGDRFTIKPQGGPSWRYDLFVFHERGDLFAAGHIRLGA